MVRRCQNITLDENGLPCFCFCFCLFPTYFTLSNSTGRSCDGAESSMFLGLFDLFASIGPVAATCPGGDRGAVELRAASGVTACWPSRVLAVCVCDDAGLLRS